MASNFMLSIAKRMATVAAPPSGSTSQCSPPLHDLELHQEAASKEGQGQAGCICGSHPAGLRKAHRWRSTAAPRQLASWQAGRQAGRPSKPASQPASQPAICMLAEQKYLALYCARICYWIGSDRACPPIQLPQGVATLLPVE